MTTHHATSPHDFASPVLRRERSASRVGMTLTARGRRLVVAAAFLLGLVVATIAFVVFDVAVASAGGATAEDTVTVTVQAGDTLWGYAEQYAPETDPQEFVREVRELNNVPTGRITAGQELVLPVETDSAP